MNELIYKVGRLSNVCIVYDVKMIPRISLLMTLSCLFGWDTIHEGQEPGQNLS